MKAVRVHSFGGPEVLKLDVVDDPTPGPGEVVVDVRAAGINPADTYMRNGTYAIVPKRPYIPGGDAGGVVSEIGADVSRVSNRRSSLRRHRAQLRPNGVLRRESEA